MLYNSNKPTLVRDDFNVHFNKECKNTLEVCELFECYGFEIINNENTRNPNSLDNDFASKYVNTNSLQIPDRGTCLKYSVTCTLEITVQTSKLSQTVSVHLILTDEG